MVKSFSRKVTPILLFAFLLLIFSTPISAENSARNFIYCNIDWSFLEKNICNTGDCPLIVEKVDFYYYKVESQNLVLYVSKINEIEVVEITFGSEIKKATQTELSFLKNICEENISPVMKYIVQKKYGDLQICSFSQNESKLLVYSWNMSNLDGGWYSSCSPYSKNSGMRTSWKIFFFSGIMGGLIEILFFVYGLMALFFDVLTHSLFLFNVFIIVPFLSLFLIIIIYYFFKKKKVRLIYLLPLLFGIIGSIVGGVIIYIKERNVKVLLKLFLLGLFISLISAFIGFITTAIIIVSVF